MSSIRLNDPTPDQVQGSLPMIVQDIATVGFYPGVLPTTVTDSQGLISDENGAAYTRAGITTDEASLRINFSGASLSRALPGTQVWTNGSTTVTGTGFLSTTVPILIFDFVKKDSDDETAWVQISSITDTTITLDNAYTGTGGTGAGSNSSLKTTTGTGGSFTVSSGTLVVASGSTNSASTYISRQVDYGPLTMSTSCTISQRIANQDIYIGFNGASLDDRVYARFRFSAAVNTVATCETGWANTAPAAGTDLQSTSITLPNGATTAVANEYRIDVDGRIVAFYINDILVATHKQVIPKPYDVLSLQYEILNGTGATTTSLTIGYIVCNNYDSVRITAANAFEPLMISSLPATDQSYNVAGIIVINTDLLIIDCTYLRTLSIQCISMGTTGVVTPSFSNDGGTTFAATTLVTTAGATALTFNAAGLWTVQVTGRLMRLRLTTATTAGTTTLRVMGMHTTAQPIHATVIASGTVTTCSTLTTLANGQTAHSSASTGNPVRIGGRVITTMDTTLAQADSSDIAITTGQQLLTKQFATAENDWSATASAFIATTSTLVRAAQAASLRNYCTGFDFQVTTFGGGACLIQILDGATVLWQCSELAIMNTPFSITFTTPLRGSAATAMNIIQATANTINYNIRGYSGF